MRPSVVSAIKAKTVEGFYGALDREKVPLRMVILATLAALREAMPMAEAYGASSAPGYDIVESLVNRIEERPEAGRVGGQWNPETMEVDYEEDSAILNEANAAENETYISYRDMVRRVDPYGSRRSDLWLFGSALPGGNTTEDERRLIVGRWVMEAATAVAKAAWYGGLNKISDIRFSAQRIAGVFFVCGGDRSPVSATTTVADARVIAIVKQSLVQQILAAAQPRSNPARRVSLVPPVEVSRQFAEGLRLLSLGLGGDGLRGETVQWAERLARGEPATPEKLRLMRAWFARHGASPLEADARHRQANQIAQGAPPRRAPALVAWLLWGGDAGRSWASQMAPRGNPTFLDHCVEKVGATTDTSLLSQRESKSRAYAICTASFQKAGYYRRKADGFSRTLTRAGTLAERRHRRHSKD
jgi:hypothetical protein